MKLLKILTPKTIFYVLVILSAFAYYTINGVDTENETDFIISLFAIAILSVVTIVDIKGKIKAMKE